MKKKKLLRMLCENRDVAESLLEDLEKLTDEQWGILDVMANDYDINNNCKACPNHPKNGGSGICHCTLGNPVSF